MARLQLSALTEDIHEAFAGVEDPDNAYYCEFERDGLGAGIIIAEPTTIQVHGESAGTSYSFGIYFAGTITSRFYKAMAKELLVEIDTQEIASLNDFEEVAGFTSLSE